MHQVGKIQELELERLQDLIRKVLFYSVAEREYCISLRWYSERNVIAAENFDKEVDLAIQAIASDPDRFPHCDSRHQFYLLRSFPFQIVFRKLGEDIYVVAIAHTSRNPNYWSDR